MTAKQDYRQQTDAVVPQSDARTGTFHSQEDAACQENQYEKYGYNDCNSAFLSKSVPQQAFVPSPVRFDVCNDECREQQAGQYVCCSPIMPHFMTAPVSGDVQSNASGCRKNENRYKCPVDNESLFHVPSLLILHRKVRISAGNMTITFVKKRSVNGNSGCATAIRG